MIRSVLEQHPDLLVGDGLDNGVIAFGALVARDRIAFDDFAFYGPVEDGLYVRYLPVDRGALDARFKAFPYILIHAVMGKTKGLDPAYFGQDGRLQDDGKPAQGSRFVDAQPGRYVARGEFLE